MSDTMVTSEVEEKKETVGEKQARELAERTAEILDAARPELDKNKPEDLLSEGVGSRVKGTVDRLTPFISSASIRFTDGVALFMLDPDMPVVQDGVTGIVLVTLKPQDT